MLIIDATESFAPQSTTLTVGDLKPGDIFSVVSIHDSSLDVRYMVIDKGKYDSLEEPESTNDVPVVALDNYHATYIWSTVKVIKLVGCFGITQYITQKEG